MSDATAKQLVGADLFLGGRAGSTVLGTANVMMAATLAEGVTIIESAACEPEVVDLANFLNAMGAKITGAGSPTITITGVKELHGAEHEVIPDRIEAATLRASPPRRRTAKSRCTARAPDHLHAVLDKLHDAGVKVERRGAASDRPPQRPTEAGGHHHAALLRFSHGRAGADDGADGADAGHQHHHRTDF